MGWGSTLGQVLGTGLGAILAAPTGGISLLAGAGLGGALGGGLGTLGEYAFGDDEKRNLPKGLRDRGFILPDRKPMPETDARSMLGMAPTATWLPDERNEAIDRLMAKYSTRRTA